MYAHWSTWKQSCVKEKTRNSAKHAAAVVVRVFLFSLVSLSRTQSIETQTSASRTQSIKLRYKQQQISMLRHTHTRTHTHRQTSDRLISFGGFIGARVRVCLAYCNLRNRLLLCNAKISNANSAIVLRSRSLLLCIRHERKTQ